MPDLGARRPTTGAGIDDVLDLDRYPLDAPGSPAWRAAVAGARSDLAQDGCSILRGVVRPEWQITLREQCAGVAHLAFDETRMVNVYNSAEDKTLPAAHPARVRMERGNAFVAQIDIPADLLVAQLYLDERFQSFVAECLGVPRVHPLADPYAGLCLNVIGPGREHPWHFDTNEYALSMVTQAPGAGGLFEYCPAIRSPEAENFAAVADVLAGRGAALIRTLILRPGDLQLFRGRYSLHRVTRIAGRTPRHSAIFAYSRRPDVVSAAERTRQLFGRTDAVHETRHRSVDSLLS